MVGGHGCDENNSDCIFVLITRDIQVDRRYQHLAFGVWITILMVFLAYGAAVLAARIILRDHPPQTVKYSPGSDMEPLRHFPSIILCPPASVLGPTTPTLDGIHCGWRAEYSGGANICEWQPVPFIPIDTSPILANHTTG